MKGKSSMRNVNYELLDENFAEIGKYEEEIGKLEEEIKSLKQKGPSTRMQVLEKQLEISKIEGEIIEITAISDRESRTAIKHDLISRKSSRYPEYDSLGRCYMQKNDLDRWNNTLEGLQIQYKILQQSGNKDPKAYAEINEKIAFAQENVDLSASQLAVSQEKFSKMYGKHVDFKSTFTEVFYEYENENPPLMKSRDIDQLYKNIEDRFYSKSSDDEFKSEEDMEKYKEDAQKQVSAIFANGLDGTSEELAQVYGELFVRGMGLLEGPIVASEIIDDPAIRDDIWGVPRKNGKKQ